MAHTACTQPQCLYKDALYLAFTLPVAHSGNISDVLAAVLRFNVLSACGNYLCLFVLQR